MKNRLQQIISTEGISALKFAEIIDVQRSTVSHILSGRNNPSLEFIQKTLNNFPQINTDWFITGRGEMYIEPASTTNERTNKSEQNSRDLFSVLKDEEQASYQAISSIGSNDDEESDNDKESADNKDIDSTINKEETANNKEKEPDISGMPISASPLERIVIFYKNGSFKEYLPQQI